MKSLNVIESKRLRAQDTLLSQRVYEIIMDWIISGEIDAGCKLNEVELSEKLGVSRMPVREALKKLEQNGLVQFAPYLGCSVKVLTKENWREAYLLRMELESYAAMEATRYVTQEELDELSRIQLKCEGLTLDTVTGKEICELNRVFHMTMYDAARMPTLVEFIERLWNTIAYYKLKVSHESYYLEKMKNEHRLYVQLMKERNGEALAEMIRQNLTRNYEKSLKDYDKYMI